MEKEEFEKKVDTEILPLLKEYLQKDFPNGWKKIQIDTNNL